MDLTKKQLSLLISTMLMMLIVLLLFNVHLASEKEEEYLYEVSLQEEDLEELLMEKELLEQELAQQQMVKTHMAFNETAKSRLDPEPLKTMEELREEAENNDNKSETDEMSNSENDYLTSSNTYASLEKYKEKIEKQRASRGNNKTEEKAAGNTSNRNTSVSYSLLDRTHVRLPIPIYTCLVSGRVVVNIKVDSSGSVVEATLNEASSSTTNGCLVDNAISYAMNAKFNANSGKPQQLGTITYLYQGK